MRKSEEMWDSEFNGIGGGSGSIHGTGCGIDGYMDAGKDDDEGGNKTKPPPTNR